MNIHEELTVILDELGIFVGEAGEFVDIDSLTYITMIIRIEETFGIAFPDDLLSNSVTNNIKNLETIILNIISGED